MPSDDALDAKLASIWDRFLAFLLDGLILIVPCLVVHFTIPFVAPILLQFLYYPIFHASPLQATIGKKMMGIRVCDMKGRPLTLGNSFLRELIAMASGICFFAGHFFALFTAKRQAIHDMAAGSIVVEAPVPEISLWNAWSSTMQRLFTSLSTSISAPSGSSQKVSEEPHVRDQIDELERLSDLRKSGAISEEEYQRLKSKII